MKSNIPKMHGQQHIKIVLVILHTAPYEIRGEIDERTGSWAYSMIDFKYRVSTFKGYGL